MCVHTYPHPHTHINIELSTQSGLYLKIHSEEGSPKFISKYFIAYEDDKFKSVEEKLASLRKKIIVILAGRGAVGMTALTFWRAWDARQSGGRGAWH